MKVSLSTKLTWSLRRRGVFATVRLGLLKGPRWISGALWDYAHRVDTTKIVELDTLDIASENAKHGIRYQPTPTNVFRKIIGDLKIDYKNFNFIDFGSGKGRTLLLASTFPFHQIIGVEFAPDLHEVAQRNIHAYRGAQRCRNIRSVCIDATLYVLPEGNCVLFFNFPFELPVMSVVRANIDQYIAQPGNSAILINYEPNPKIGRLLDGDTLIHLTRRTRDYAVYRSVCWSSRIPAA